MSLYVVMYESLSRAQLESALAYFESQVENEQNRASEFESLARRHKAEKENLRDRQQSRIEKAEDEAKEELLSEFIDVIDDFERALDAVDESNEVYKGVEMIKQKFENKLSKQGLEKIDTDGEFNPDLHKAVEKVESDEPSKSIVAEKKPGYKKGDYVVREAHVAVSTDDSETGDSE